MIFKKKQIIMKFNLIVAHDQNYGIGKDNKLPFHSPSDLRRFSRLIKDTNIIVGKKTYKSILEATDGKFLKGIKNTYITSNYLSTTDMIHNDSVMSNDLHTILFYAKKRYEDDGIFSIIGGATIYEQLAPYCEFWYVSKIKGQFDCDTYFKYDDFYNLELIYEVDCADHVFCIYRNKDYVKI